MTNINYLENDKYAVFNGLKYVRDDKTGYYTRHGDNGSAKRLHVDVWEFYNCKVPYGYEVHHKDHDKSNNDISNLRLLSKGEHSKLHRIEMTEEQKERRRKNLDKNVRPAASKWHKSEEGRAWHSEQMKKVMSEREKRKYNCTFCGKEFETTNYYSDKENRFCCNNCKSAYRRKMGYDNIERVCEYCGKTFVSGKYQKRRYCCKSCAAYGRNRTRKGD